MKRQICALVPILAVISICGYAQDERYYQMSIDEMFELADANSKSIKTYEIYEREADQSVRNARNDRLPSIEFSASASYLGDGWMADRNFSNGMNAPMPHFGNNFAVEAAQVVYAGGSVSSNIAMAKLNYRQAQLDTENNRQNVRFMLVGDYPNSTNSTTSRPFSARTSNRHGACCRISVQNTTKVWSSRMTLPVMNCCCVSAGRRR